MNSVRSSSSSSSSSFVLPFESAFLEHGNPSFRDLRSRRSSGRVVESVMAALRKIWDSLARGSLFQQVDKRTLQHEIDTHRLFLLTSFHREGLLGSTERGNEIEKLAEATPYEAQQRQVQELVHGQVRQMTSTLDNILLKAPDISKRSPTPEKKRPSGLSFAVGVPPEVEQQVPSRTDVVETRPLNKAQVATAFANQQGFSLQLKPSNIAHKEAGLGLFICGRACPGTVVSLYPGIIYSPSQYRYMPGYPKVDADNAYLISRYDGLVIDGKPWGKGGDEREWWDGSDFETEKGIEESLGNSVDSIQNNTASEQVMNNARRRPTSIWQLVGGGKERGGPLEGAELDRRNPLAFGHFANHPPKGLQPNVMICSYTLSVAGEQSIRPYIPNVMFGNDEELDMQRRGPLWVNEGRKVRHDEPERNLATVEISNLPNKGSSDIRTLVLVATREVHDEELMLNYRLSGYVHQPSWYHPVDVEEEQRRWD